MPVANSTVPPRRSHHYKGAGYVAQMPFRGALRPTVQPSNSENTYTIRGALRPALQPLEIKLLYTCALEEFGWKCISAHIYAMVIFPQAHKLGDKRYTRYYAPPTLASTAVVRY